MKFLDLVNNLKSSSKENKKSKIEGLVVITSFDFTQYKQYNG